MSSQQITQSINLVINDHVPVSDGSDDGEIECLCGAKFPYYSRWSLHVSQDVVGRVFGGDL